MLLNSTLGKESTEGTAHHTFSFGEFVLDVDRGALLRSGADVHLRPKCFEVLTYFVRHQGVLISKEELLSAVWSDVVVTEDSLAQCLIQIRKSLGDRSKTIVRTVRGRGYLFDVPVTNHDPVEIPSAEPPAKARTSYRRPSPWSVAAIVVLSLAIVATWWSGGRQGPAGEDTAQVAESYSSRAYQHNLKGRFFHSRRSPGDLELAIEQFEMALDIDPGAADYINGSLLEISILQYQINETESLVLRLPDGLNRDMGLATVHYARGELTESARIIERMSFDPSVEAAVRLAEIYAYRAALNESFKWLRLATERQLVAGLTDNSRELLERIRSSPFFFPLHNDPRWKERLDLIEGHIPPWPELRFSLSSN